MNNKWAMLLLGATFFATLTAMKMPPSGPETAPFNVEIVASDGLRLQLTGQNLTGQKLHLKLFREEETSFGYRTETVFYTEKIAPSETAINRTLNLSQLESGKYQLEIRSGKTRILRHLEIGNELPAVISPARIVFVK